MTPEALNEIIAAAERSVAAEKAYLESPPVIRGHCQATRDWIDARNAFAQLANERTIKRLAKIAQASAALVAAIRCTSGPMQQDRALKDLESLLEQPS